MSTNNWLNPSDEAPPSYYSNRYRIDNVGLGLQLGLGYPVQLVGSTSGDNQAGQSSHNSWTSSSRSYRANMSQPKEVDLKKTVDGIPIRTVYITNIHHDADRQEILSIFSKYGRIVNIHLRFSKHGNNKQFAFVTFVDPGTASNVLQQKTFQDYRGRTIYAAAADSWHQPEETPDGKVLWKNGQRHQNNKQETEEENNAEVPQSPIKQVQFVQEDGLNSLNDDCLMHIFSFLSWKQIAGVERVCKRWHALSHRMWRFLRELNVTKPPFDKMQRSTLVLEQCLKRCGESLSTLELTGSNNDYDRTVLVVIAKYCTNLEELHLANVPIGSRCLAHIGRRCTRLKKLIVDRCVGQFNDQNLMSLLPKCADLTHLELKHCEQLTGQCLAKVSGPVSTLVLVNCPKVNTVNLIAGVQNMAGSLQELALSSCGVFPDSKTLYIIMSSVPQLSALTLSNCVPHLDNQCMALVGTLACLTRVDLSLNLSVNDTLLAALTDGCPQIHTLNISSSGGDNGNLTEAGVSLLGKLRKMVTLDLSYLDATTDSALKKITSRNTKLKSLLCRGCPSITDEGSSHVVAVSNDLELFDLSGCTDVSCRTTSAANTSVKMRTNNTSLKIIVGGTDVITNKIDNEEPVPQLTIDMNDYSEEHLRPDFIEDMFFPPSDDEEDDEEELELLCERIGCECDFVCDDFNDPTLCCVYDSPLQFGLDEDCDEYADFSDDGDVDDADEIYDYQVVAEEEVILNQ